MSRKASEVSMRPAVALLQPYDSDSSFNGFNSDDSIEKDKTELELEKLVFGDEAGFQEGLSTYERKYHTGENDLEGGDRLDDGQVEEDQEGLEGLDDADLFFLDTKPSAVPQSSLEGVENPETDDVGGRGAAAWVDSDDDRIMVSLASNPRLRKLRNTESEDLVNGREYTKRLRRQFEKLCPVPSWAKASAAVKPSHKRRRRLTNASQSSSDDPSADERSIDSEDLSVPPLTKLLQNNIDLIKPSSSGGGRLRPEAIDIQRTKDVGLAQPSTIDSLSFHPIYPLILSSGPASTLFLHHLSPHPPNPNPLLTAFHLRHTPISTSAFLPPNGNKIFFSGRRRYFHSWDLSSGKIDKVTRVYGHRDEQRTMERFKLSPCGRWMGLVGSGRKGSGLINILDACTCQWIAEVRVEGRGGVADFAWWDDGEGMVVLGKGGEAVEWSVAEKRVVATWADDGAVGITVASLGGAGSGPKSLGGNRWLAVGSSSGIINLYDRTAWKDPGSVPSRPKPIRVFDHLTTPTSHLQFSPNGQLLLLASRWKRNALRLVHLPSCTVYRNWPSSGTPLGRISAVAFSPGSDMLAVANEQGKIRLWEIRG